MLNVQTEIKGDKLIITVDLSKDFGASKSGKTTIIASTQGNVNTGNGAILGLNVYKARQL